MQANELTKDRLRELAGTTAPGGVLSLFVNLDPREFATPPARDSQVRSVLDRAEKVVREAEAGLDHDGAQALRGALELAARTLRTDLDASGAHGLAVFVAGSDLHVVKLPRGIDHDPVVSDGPCLEPITEMADGETWAVLLANRRVARLFVGTKDHLDEVEHIDDETMNQHSQGGWSQARYQRSVDEDVQKHLQHTAEVAFAHLGKALPTGIVVGGPSETVGDVEHALHPYLRARLAGRIEVDVENTSADAVFKAAHELFESKAREREEELLGRLREGLGRPEGRAVAGLDAVLAALHERRVESLLIEPGFHAEGSRCPQCEMLHTTTSGTCPADGVAVEPLPDVVASAMDAAIGQDAAVVVLHDRPDLGPHGRIAAVTRF